jgi:hypothetical protein
VPGSNRRPPACKISASLAAGFRLLADSAYLRGKEKEAIRELEINGRIDRLKAQLTSALGVSLD